ncbi:MAG: DUF4011 domain-containing protein, partial [Thermomicrobiales bacterium]
MTSSTIEAKLAQWRAELLSLTRANPLVNFNPRRRMLTLTHPTPEAIFDGLVNRGRTFTFYRPPEVPLDQEPEAAPGPEQWPLLFPVEEAANGLPILPVESPVEASATEPVAGGEQPFLGEPSVPAASVPTPQPKASEIVVAGDPKKSEALLYRLRLRSRAALQEQGINVLFVAFGVLDWRETPTSQERLISPLLLVPVQLERETALKPYQIQVLDEPVLNPALVRKLATDFNLPLALPDDEILDFSLIPLLDYLREAVAGQAGWVVREEAYLGLFSFAKYAMYADLEANCERFAAHPVIRFLGGEPDVLLLRAVQPPSADQLDASCAPADTFQVLDADASQQETIAAVKAGLNLIVQGPPGTGKSQTITNIIAEMLAAEKTVLFVSEKKDALKVVARRLREVGLGDFCLEAHEQGLDKGAVIKNLASTLQAGNGVHPDPNAAYKLAQTAQMRRQLNEYVSALHDAQNPLGRSAFQIHGELAARATIPIVTFTLPEIGALTPERLATLTDAVQHLVRVGDVLQGADTHPWRDTTLTAYNPQIRAELTECLKHLTENASELVTVQETIDAVWGLPKCATLTRARWLHELLALADERMTVPADWFRSSSLQPLLRTAADHHRQSDDYHRRRAALLARYTAALFSLDLPTIRQALATSGLPQTERITGMGTPGDRALTRQERISAAVRRALDCLASVARTSEIVAERLGLPIPKTLARAREVARVAALVLTNPRPLPEWFEIQQRIMIEQLAQDAGARRATVTTDRPPLEQRFTPEFFILATEERKERFADKYASWLRALRPSYHRELRELRQCLREPGELDYADALACLTQARRVASAEDWLRDQQSALAAGFGWHFAGAQTDWPAVSQALASMRELYVLLGQRGWPPALKGVLLGENGGPVALRPAVHDLDAAINAVESAWGDLATSMSVQNLPFSGAGLDDYLLFPLHDWLRDWLAAVQPLWEADRALRECRKDSSAILPVADLLADACEAAAVCELEQSLMMGAEALRASFGTLFSGLETNWQTVLDALQWVGRMRDHFSGPPPESFVAALLADRQTPLAERARLATLIAATSEQVERLRSWFTAEGLLIDTDAPDDAALDVIAVWATEKLAAIPLLEEWLHYCQALRAAEAVGLVPFVERIRRAGLPPVDWPAIFLKQVYTLWLTWRYEQAPALEHFRWREHEAVVREFANLDRWQYQTAVRRITERLVARRPAVPYAPPRMSEPGILLHEAGKRRRFLPPRKLFAQLPNLLPALKPCLLMSPP